MQSVNRTRVSHQSNSAESKSAAEVAKLSDLKNSKVPISLYWDCEQVGRFFDDLNLPEYKETLMRNNIDGRRLIYMDASHLPKLGIQDFKHIQLITKSVRELLQIETPFWNRSITLPPRDQIELYLEAKSYRGVKSNRLNYDDFSRSLEPNEKGDAPKWQPPLTNQGFTMPSF